MNQAEFASKFGVTASAISRIENGERVPSKQLILSICRELGINRNWLETGEGDMMDKSVEQDIELLTRAMEGNSSAKKQLIRIVAAMPDDLLESMVNYLKTAIKEPEA